MSDPALLAAAQRWANSKGILSPIVGVVDVTQPGDPDSRVEMVCQDGTVVRPNRGDSSQLRAALWSARGALAKVRVIRKPVVRLYKDVK